jgi:hypothetical protein
MRKTEYANYFKLNDRQKYEVQSELFATCAVLAIKMSDKEPKQFAWTVYEAAIYLGNKWLDEERFELVQAINDMIQTYDLERHLDHRAI